MSIRLTPRDANGGQELAGASLADLISQLAEAVAEGQAKLDLSSAQVAAELAKTKVKFIPAIRQIIEKDGSVRFEQAEPMEVSLLDLGLQPTFYSFSEATVEVAMDLKVVEETTTTGSGRAPAKMLFASTRSLRTERKLNRDVKISSKMSAKLVPVPAPPLLGPARDVEDRREGGGA
ncbi:MAG: hypothetical protein NNA31_10010 [Nitrospira sp.]|nr:hypothetical protein [Nitrospira sp.]